MGKKEGWRTSNVQLPRLNIERGNRRSPIDNSQRGTTDHETTGHQRERDLKAEKINRRKGRELRKMLSSEGAKKRRRWGLAGEEGWAVVVAREPIANACGGSFQGRIVGDGSPDARVVQIGKDPCVLEQGPHGLAYWRELSSVLALVGLHISTATKTECDGSPGQGG